MGWARHATGALGLAAMIIAASLAFMRAGTWPTWAGWLGVVVGILSLASVAFFPQFLFLLWILIVSILMFLRSKPAAQDRLARRVSPQLRRGRRESPSRREPGARLML